MALVCVIHLGIYRTFLACISTLHNKHKTQAVHGQAGMQTPESPPLHSLRWDLWWSLWFVYHVSIKFPYLSNLLQLYYVCSSPHAIHLDNHVDDIIITYLVTEEKSECMLFALSSVHSFTPDYPNVLCPQCTQRVRNK